MLRFVDETKPLLPVTMFELKHHALCGIEELLREHKLIYVCPDRLEAVW